MTQNITLGSEVFVTDPCYTVPTWCQLKLSNVLPGEWIASMIFDELHGTNRNAELYVVHKDFQNSKNLMFDWAGDFGVDSGQAGVFNAASYRDDSTVAGMKLPESDFVLPRFDSDEPGTDWYEAMCKITLTGDNWGAYDQGVVSSSGWGDGHYAAYAAENAAGQIVALQLVFIDQSADLEDEDEDWDEDLKFVEEQEDDL